jgi:hypothetical protein
MRPSKLLALSGLCWVGLFCPNLTAQKTLNANPGYTITIASSAQPTRISAPVNVTITVTNISNKDLDWRAEKHNTAYRAFNFALTNRGREIETTVFHRKLTGKQRPEDPLDVGNGGSFLGTLTQGRSVTYTVDLKQLYQITEPGAYTLDVNRVEDDNKTVVRSNTLTLNIVP